MIDKAYLIAIVAAGLIAAAVIAPSIHPATVVNNGTVSLSFNAELNGTKLCWTAGGWLEYYGEWPDTWLQHLTVTLDGKVIFDKFTSGNGLMKSACITVEPGKHTMKMTYRAAAPRLYVRKAWLGVDIEPHLAYNGLPYPGLYKFHKKYYNYPPNYDVRTVIITANIVVKATETNTTTTTSSTVTGAPALPTTSAPEPTPQTTTTTTAPPPITAPINPSPPNAPNPLDVVQAIINWLKSVFHW